MSKKTLGLIVLLLILTIVLVVVALNTKRTSTPPTQTTKPSATPSPLAPGHASLTLSPNPVYPATGSTSATTVDVLIDTGGDNVRSVQLEIAYDPKAITNVSLKPGTFFSNPSVLPVGGVNQNTGRITYAIVPNSFSEAKNGTGVVATLTFTPILSTANPVTDITLLDKSLVSGQARGQNVLIKTSGTRVMLKTTTKPATDSAR